MSQKKTTKKSIRKTAKAKKSSVKSDKLNSLQQTNGKVYEGDEELQKVRQLEDILDVSLTNPFGTSHAKVFEENLAEMNLSEMQELAVRAGIFPSGNQSMLRNKLKKAFKSKHPDQLQVVVDKGAPIKLDPKNPKHKELIDYLNN